MKAYYYSSSLSSRPSMRYTVPAEPRIKTSAYPNIEEDEEEDEEEKDNQGDDNDVPVVNLGTIDFHRFLSWEEEPLVGLQFAYSMDWEDDLSVDDDNEEDDDDDCTQSISTNIVSSSLQSKKGGAVSCPSQFSQRSSRRLSSIHEPSSSVCPTVTSDATTTVPKGQLLLPPRKNDPRHPNKTGYSSSPPPPPTTTTASTTSSSSLRFFRSIMRPEGGRKRILPILQYTTIPTLKSRASLLSADVKRPSQPKQYLPTMKKKSNEKVSLLTKQQHQEQQKYEQKYEHQHQHHTQGYYDRLPFWNRCFA